MMPSITTLFQHSDFCVKIWRFSEEKVKKKRLKSSICNWRATFPFPTAELLDQFLTPKIKIRKKVSVISLSCSLSKCEDEPTFGICPVFWCLCHHFHLSQARPQKSKMLFPWLQMIATAIYCFQHITNIYRHSQD